MSNVSKMIDVNRNNMVNNIPTSYYFKRLCGRTGPFCMKKKCHSVNRIANALKKIETVRHAISLRVIPDLRAVRKECASFENDYSNSITEADERIVRQVSLAISSRIETIANIAFPHDKAANIEQIDENIFENFYVDVEHRHVGGPGRNLDKHYMHERGTQRHIPHKEYSEWLASSTKLSLNQWLDTVYRWQKEDNSNRLNYNAQVNGVRYLDATERLNYQINVQAGRVTDFHGNVVHTGNLRSITVGSGFGIYVLSTSNHLYLGEHTVGEFHHSSFLSGAPVLAGGEIAINNGSVVGLTNKTGHYKAQPAELNRMLTMLANNQVNLDNVAVQDPFRRPGKWFTGTDAMQANGILTTLGDDIAVPKPIIP